MYLKGRPITMFMPKEQVDSYCLEARGELPSNKLKLDWVYPSCACAALEININYWTVIVIHLFKQSAGKDDVERVKLINVLHSFRHSRMISSRC